MKLNTITNNDKPLVNLRLCTMLFCLFLTRNAYSNNTTNAPEDIVAFFKQAISSPPDIERYVIGQRNLQSPPILQSAQSNSIQYFQGARSGTNYFLCKVASSNAPIDSNQRELFAGRVGSSTYEIGKNGISYGIGTNGFTANIKALFNLTRQFLDMGAGEIEPKSITWNGNKFVATNSYGFARYGELEVSNNLPYQMKISAAESSSPLKVIEYMYPQPATSFSGFPSKMLISVNGNDGLKPAAELTFQYVQIAAQPLPDDFFSDVKFRGPSVIHTNIHSNSVLYVSNMKSGKMVKAPDSILKSGGYTNTKPRIAIYLCLAFTTIAPVAIIFVWWFKKNTTKQTTLKNI